MKLDPLASRRRFIEFVRRGSTDGAAQRKMDLAEAALLIAQEEYLLLDPQPYLAQLDAFAARVKKGLSRDRGPMDCIGALNRVLFVEEGFTGNAEEYYDPRNSFLNEVLDRRKGLPITLSLVYMETARRAGIPVAGVGLPGHFIVRFLAGGGPKAPPYLIDAFHQGVLLSEEDCAERVRRIYGGKMPFRRDYLQPVTGFAVLSRMLYNLKNIYVESKSYAKAYTVLDHLMLLNPDSWDEVRDRGVVLYRLKQYRPALRDIELYLSKVPAAPDRDDLLQLAQIIKRKARKP